VQLLASDLVLAEFEGPLDLLLHLVRKHELDIFNIPISFITARYLETIEQMRALNVDIAGEYLLMAATLAYLKSRELLPPDGKSDDEPQNPEEEGEDPRQSLIKRLLAYQRFKEAAQFLSSRPVMGRNVFARGLDPAVILGPTGEAPLAEVPVWELLELLAKTLSKGRRKLAHEVTVERLSLADRINDLCEHLAKKDAFVFTDLLGDLAKGESIERLGYQIVLTFMAVLEMARLKLLHVEQKVDRGEVLIRRVEGAILPLSPRQGELPFDESTEATDTEQVADHHQVPDVPADVLPSVDPAATKSKVLS
jgi:segregation and condensation protein A